MLYKVLVVSLVVGLSQSTLAATAPTSGSLTAVDIVNKNIAARGGLQAWRAVRTLSETGKLGAGGDRRGISAPAQRPVVGTRSEPLQTATSERLTEEAELPFVMEMERPRKVRMEIQFAGSTALQVYDGTNGWKLRPYLNRTEVEPFSEEELKAASMQPDLDGFLVDYGAKGNRLVLDGIEKVNDRDTYKLKVTMKSGQVQHVWIDAETFLEAKIEGQPRRLDGKMHPVEIYLRDFRRVDGLQFPFVLETHVLPLDEAGKGIRGTSIPAEKIVIDMIKVNPKLDTVRFEKPQLETTSAHR